MPVYSQSAPSVHSVIPVQLHYTAGSGGKLGILGTFDWGEGTFTGVVLVIYWDHTGFLLVVGHVTSTLIRGVGAGGGRVNKRLFPLSCIAERHHGHHWGNQRGNGPENRHIHIMDMNLDLDLDWILLPQ